MAIPGIGNYKQILESVVPGLKMNSTINSAILGAAAALVLIVIALRLTVCKC